MGKIINYLYWTFNRTIYYIEKLFPSDEEIPTIFIIGAPRSGSTLLYQIMTQYFDIAFLTNIHCRFFGAISLTERIFSTRSKDKNSVYESKHGRVKGLYSPSECGPFWKLMEKKGSKDMKKEIGRIGKVLKKPIIFKNLHNSLRLDWIAKTLPHSYFLIIERDIIDNACSILNSRKRTFDNYDSWFSVKPDNYEKIKDLPPAEQIIEQIKGIYRSIDKNMPSINSDRFMRVRYEEMCKNPKKIMKDIRIFFDEKGISLKKNKNNEKIPKKFTIRKSKVEGNMLKQLRAYTKKISKKHKNE